MELLKSSRPRVRRAAARQLIRFIERSEMLQRPPLVDDAELAVALLGAVGLGLPGKSQEFVARWVAARGHRTTK